MKWSRNRLRWSGNQKYFEVLWHQEDNKNCFSLGKGTNSRMNSIWQKWITSWLQGIWSLKQQVSRKNAKRASPQEPSCGNALLPSHSQHLHPEENAPTGTRRRVDPVSPAVLSLACAVLGRTHGLQEHWPHLSCVGKELSRPQADTGN